LREGKDALQRDVAAAADMDVAVLSKIELGQRVATEEQTRSLAKFFRVNETEAQARRLGLDLKLFADLDEADRYVRTISAPFGEHTDAQWRTLAESWVRKNEDGTWRPHYDLRIADIFKATMPDKDLELWHVYDAVRCPTLLIRGERSDVVSRAVATEMTRRGPKAKVVEIRNVGHAPTLLHADQIAVVRDFLHQGGEPS
jgi:pimeloyl-ACP methyl ester carboxylesterase